MDELVAKLTPLSEVFADFWQAKSMLDFAVKKHAEAVADVELWQGRYDDAVKRFHEVAGQVGIAAP